MGMSGPPGPSGPVGKPGSAGEPGQPGPQGNAGPTGQAGQMGPIGKNGPKGNTGDRGAQGHKGTRGHVGAPGNVGPQGAQGDAGVAGPAGQAGARGEPGARGPAGTEGARGPVGPPGVAGSRGRQGEMGPAGRDGTSGPPGPPGPPGKTPFIPLPAPGAFKGNQNDAVEEMQIPVESLKLLKQQIDNLDGGAKKSSPRTCSDIYVQARAQGEIPASDNYYVDPNGGSESDAIEVFCKFDDPEVQTCVYPSNTSVSPISYKSENAVDSSQLGFLRVNYKYASQKVTFDCADGRPEITLRSDTDFAFTMQHQEVRVHSDSCSSNGELVLEVTSRSRNMPISEIDEGNFEMDPVCFFA